MSLSDISWEHYCSLGREQKAAILRRDDRLFHVLLSQQFGRDELEDLGTLATQIRLISKDEDGCRFLRELLAHRRAMLYFSQPSTRTFLSFCAACQILGISIGEVRDTSTSSELKGETQEDSVRAFSSYFDLIIMRTKIGGLAEKMAWALSQSERPVPIINAGSGKDQHPTQSLLDIYTLQRSFENRGGIDGKKVIFVGDLARGRTVRSLAYLLTNYDKVEQHFVAPPNLQISEDVVAQLREKGAIFELSDDFKSRIPMADAIYMTRIQDEWDDDKTQGGATYSSEYCFGPEDLKALREDAVVMHPLPRRNEISTEVDSDPRAVYWRQMRNGMWIRAALIATIFGKAEAIDARWQGNERGNGQGNG